MELNNKNHRLWQFSDSLGLWPNRLVYVGQDKPMHRVGDAERKDMPSVEDAKKVLEKLDLQQKALAKKVDEYNAKFSKKNPTKAYEKELVMDPSDPSKTLTIIHVILNTPLTYRGIPFGTMSDTVLSTKMKVQRNALQELQTEFQSYQTALNKPEVRSARQAIPERAVTSWRRMEEIQKQQSEWAKNPHYQTLSNEYDRVFSGPMGEKKFQLFYTRPDGTKDVQLERENKQLFLAILSKETNNFSNDFPLGNKFQDNWEDNRKNFPFLYQKWLELSKSRSNEHAVEGAKQKVAEKEQEIREKNIPGPDGIVTEINNYISASARSAELKISPFKWEEPPSRSGISLYHTERAKNIRDIKKRINTAAHSLDKSKPAVKAFNKFLDEKYKQFDEHIALEKLKYRHLNLKEHLGDANKSFTRSELMKPGNRQTVLELAMLQYQRAMQIVDSANQREGGSMERLWNPAVRRMLIAMIYREGVAYYDKDGKGEYKDDVQEEYKWLLAELAQSAYFNQLNKERFLGSEHREFLILGRAANWYLLKIKYNQDYIIEPLKQLQAMSVGTEKTKLAEALMPRLNSLPQSERFTSAQNVIDRASAAVTTEEARLENWKKYVEEAKALMKEPEGKTPDELKKSLYRKRIREFIERIYKAPSARLMEKRTNKELLDEFAAYINTVDLNYNSQDLEQKSTSHLLERFGIHPETLYKGYLAYLKKNPGMKADQWDNHLMTKEGTGKLAEMFKDILPDSSVFTGKEDFLTIFSTLNGYKPSEVSPGTRDSKHLAFILYKTIALEIKHREEQEAFGSHAMEAATRMTEGQTFGDRVTEYARGLINMLMGPGQSIANRAAGAALVYMVYRMAKSAVKGENATGKLMRLVFLGGALELGLKHVTGQGILDRFKLAGLPEALGKTYEAVLLGRGDRNEIGKNITPPMTRTEHAAALVEMRTRNVPFDQLLEWYESTKIDGSPLPGKERVKLPGGLDMDNIVRGQESIVGDKEKRGKAILKLVLRNFFDYVGGKEQKDANAGKDILKEVWIKSIRDRDFALKSAVFTRRGMGKALLEDLRANPKLITWAMVMESEIHKSDVEKEHKQELFSRLGDYLREKGEWLQTWTRRDIMAPTGVAAKAFWENVNQDYTPRIQKFLESMANGVGKNLRYYSHKAELWYDGNKIEIRRVWGEHWELFTDIAKLPFQILYAGNQWVTGLVSTKLRQTREILRSDRLTFLETDSKQPKDLERRDIHSIKATEGYFGKRNALGFGTAFGDREKFHRDEGGIGYHISEMSQEAAGVKKEDDEATRLNKMQLKAYKNSKELFIRKYPQLDEKDIHKYMYPIHMYAKASRTERTPEKIYFFFRMPLPGSRELALKKAPGNRWPDYMDPNKIKHREPFVIVPNHPKWWELMKAYGLLEKTPREGVNFITRYAAQIIRFYAGASELLCKAIGFGLEKTGQHQLAATFRNLPMGEKKLKWADEFLGSAADHTLAMSNHYKNKTNAEQYAARLEYAIKHKKPLSKVPWPLPARPD